MNTATIHQAISRQRTGLLILVGLSVGLMGLALAAPAQAQQSKPDAHVQITLSPTNRTMDIKAASSYDGSFTIFNSGDAKLDFTVYAAPYQVKNEQYDPSFSTETNRTQIARWVEFDQKKYTLEPGGRTEVAYTVTTPDSIPDGGQYAALFAQTEGEKEGGSIVSQKRVGMLLYAHSDGKAINKGSSQDPALSFWQSSPKFNLVQKVKNSGNTDFTAEVSLSLSDIFGNKKFKAKTSNAVLPDTTRGIELDWEDAPSLALINVSTSVKLLGKTTHYKHLVLFATPTAVFFIAGTLLLIIGGGVYVYRQRTSKPTTRGN